MNNLVRQPGETDAQLLERYKIEYAKVRRKVETCPMCQIRKELEERDASKQQIRKQSKKLSED